MYDGNDNNTRNLSLIENRYLISSFLKISDILTIFVFHSRTPKCLHSNQNLYISYLSPYVIIWCIFTVKKPFLNFVSTKSFRPTLDRSKKICLIFRIFVEWKISIFNEFWVDSTDFTLKSWVPKTLGSSQNFSVTS